MLSRVEQHFWEIISLRLLEGKERTVEVNRENEDVPNHVKAVDRKSVV